MPIIFKSKLSSSVANATFLDKTIDDLKKGKLGLYKTLPTDPDAIADTQVFINELANVSGVVGEGDPASKTYSSHEVITDGDDRKVAIGKLDAQVKVNLDNIATNTTNISNNATAISKITTTTYANEAIAISGSITKLDDFYTQVRRISGDAAPVSASTTPFGDSSTTLDGVLVILRGTDAVNTVTITNNDIQYGAILNGDATLGLYDQLELMYDSVVERWIEQRRNF